MKRVYVMAMATAVGVTLAVVAGGVAVGQLPPGAPTAVEDRDRRGGSADSGQPVALPANAQRYEQDASAMRGRVVHIYIDPQGRRLAAWQFELRDRRAGVEGGGSEVVMGGVEVVGVESGDGAFAPDADRPSRPYYDPAALRASGYGRIVVGDFSLAEADVLPRDEVRVASVHVRLTGAEQSRFEATLQAAADPEGQPIEGATIRIETTGDDDVTP